MVEVREAYVYTLRYIGQQVTCAWLSIFVRKEVNAMGLTGEVADKIRQMIAERLDRKLEEVTDEARFIDDLGADSLDQTELLMALEEEFNIETDDDANQIETVGDAIKYIQSKL